MSTGSPPRKHAHKAFVTRRLGVISGQTLNLLPERVRIRARVRRKWLITTDFDKRACRRHLPGRQSVYPTQKWRNLSARNAFPAFDSGGPALGMTSGELKILTVQSVAWDIQCGREGRQLRLKEDVLRL